MTLARLDKKIASEKYRVCQGCKFSKTHLRVRWCGIPLLGNAVEHNGKVIELCGCAMKLKSQVEGATCPAGFWDETNNEVKKVGV